MERSGMRGSRLARARPGAQPGLQSALQRLRLEYGVPVEIVEPALVQVIRREQPAVAMQVMHARLERHLGRPHPGFGGRQIALPEIALRACGDDVDPGGVTAARARQQMVEREIVARTAKLAHELVAQEYVEPG